MPPVTRRAWGVLAAIAIAILLLSWRHSVRDEDAGPAAAMQATPATPSPTAPQLTTRLPPPMAAPPTEDAQVEDPLISQARDASTRIATSGRDQLRARYSSERIDAGWATAKEQALARLGTSAQIDAVGAKPTSFNARCRSSMCLIHADFPTRRAAEDWFTLYTLDAVAEMPNVSVQTLANPDGGVRLELYGFARPPAP